MRLPVPLRIALAPYKLSETELEATLEDAAPLYPGQMLRLEGDAPVYAEVLSLKRSRNGESRLIRLKVLLGAADLNPTTAVLMDPETLGREIASLFGSVPRPLAVGETLVSDLERLGPLGWVEGDSPKARHLALLTLIQGIQPHRSVLVLDASGGFAELAVQLGVKTLRAGEGPRLSLQNFGVNRFLGCLSDALPPALQAETLRLLAEQIPATPDFIPFRHFLRPDRFEEGPAKTLLLHWLHQLHGQNIFADRESDCQGFESFAQSPLTVLDFFGYPDAWARELYLEACRDALALGGGAVQLVLVAPGLCLSDLDVWLARFEEAELPVLVVSSPLDVHAALKEKAGNRFQAEPSPDGGAVWLRVKGALTLDLSVTVPLPFGLGDFVLEESESPAAEVTGEEPRYRGFVFPEADDEEFSLAEETAAPHSVRPVPVAPEPRLAMPPAVQALPTASEETPSPLEELVEEDEEDFPDWATTEPSREWSPPPGDEPEMPREPAHSPPPSKVSGDGMDDALDDLFDGAPDLNFGIDTGPAYQPARPTSVQYLETEESAEEEEVVVVVAPPNGISHEDDDDFSFSLEGFPLGDEMGLENMDMGDGDWETDPRILPGGEDLPPTRRAMDDEREEASRQAGFLEGDSVRHETYGVGVVKKVIPMDGNVVLNIVFESVGKRLLDPARAKLEKV